jgi:hypothetical protein
VKWIKRWIDQRRRFAETVIYLARNDAAKAYLEAMKSRGGLTARDLSALDIGYRHGWEDGYLAELPRPIGKPEPASKDRSDK